MTAVASLLLLLSVVEGQAAPLQELAIPALRVHVWASEELAPDSLRGLARPGVTLWVSTRSNILRQSMLENLRRFDETYVQLRSPILDVHARQLREVPAAGVWMDASELGRDGLARVGGRRFAVRVKGALPEELAGRIAALRPARIDWEPEAAGPSLAEWARFAELGGAKTVRLPGGECRFDISGRHRVTLVAPVGEGAMVTARNCGLQLRAQISPSVPLESLRVLYAQHPSAELELRVGDDERQAYSVRELVRRLAQPPRQP